MIARFHRALGVLIAGFAITTAVSAGEPVEDGSRFYEHGDERITATLVGPGIERPSTAFACIGCHGADGKGGREGGVAVPPITWRHLAAPSEMRPAYDRAALRRALEDGIDPAGRVFHPTMPRYRIDQETAGALVAYLDVIGRQAVAGVTAKTIRLATVIPKDSQYQDGAKIAADVMHAIVESANRAGGTYGRSIVFEVFSDEAPLPPDLFALIGRTAPPAEMAPRLLDLFPLYQDPDADTKGVKFRLLPSLEDQARLIVQKIASTTDRAMLVAADDRRYRRAADAAEREAASISGFRLERHDLETGDPGALFRKAENRPLIYVADGSQLAEHTITRPPLRIWAPLDLMASTLPALLAKPGLSLTLLNPHIPTEANHNRRRQVEAIIQDHDGERQHYAVAARAAAAAFATIDCLRATGRRLTQSTFDTACSKIPAIETGLTAPILPGRPWTTDAAEWLIIDGGVDQRDVERW